MNLELYLAFGIGRFFEISLPIENCNEASEKNNKRRVGGLSDQLNYFVKTRNYICPESLFLSAYGF